MNNIQKATYLKQSERDKMRYAREMENYVNPPGDFDDQPGGGGGGTGVESEETSAPQTSAPQTAPAKLSSAIQHELKRWLELAGLPELEEPLFHASLEELGVETWSD